MEKLKKYLPHLVAVVLYLVISFSYFSPCLTGMKLNQHDTNMWRGSAQELIDYREQTGQQSLWTGSMFSGMPAYLIGVDYKGALLKYVDRLVFVTGSPAFEIFVTMLGFYILLLVMGVNPWLSIVGGIAYGFSTYFFVIIGAGHNSKIRTIAYVAPMIASMLVTLRGKYLRGLLFFSLLLGLNLYSGHPQITYYAVFMMVALFIAEFFVSKKQKQLPTFFKGVGVLVIAGIIAFGANFSRLWSTYDYGKDSIRGPSELTSQAHVRTSGLDKDYAMQWSYGKMETFNLLIPNLMGGSSSFNLGTDCHTYDALRSNFRITPGQSLQITQNLPTYWGPQPMTSGPVYLGAIVVFLFILGLILIKGPYKWAILCVSAITVMLSWGHNFQWLSNLFFDYFPAYNKFRTVSMILYVVEIAAPLLGFMAVNQFITNKLDKQVLLRALKWATGITAGICLVFGLFGGAMFDFVAAYDGSLGFPDQLVESLRADRAAMLRNDAFRSLAFVLIAALLLFLLLYKKLKISYFAALLGLSILIDMWVVNKRFINNSQFEKPAKVLKPFVATAADKQILADTTYYRVFNLTLSPFNDASTSYFHKSIGGYHGAKLRRYQDLIDFHLSKLSPGVINMLNTKYIIQKGADGPEARLNPGANGPVWFVDSLVVVENADEEIERLGRIDTRAIALVDKRFASQIEAFKPGGAPTDSIWFTKYRPNSVDYEYRAETDRFAVFSEIYYEKGWKASIDGSPAPHVRTNYTLRGMLLPAGQHKVEFVFAPKMWKIGNAIDYTFSFIIFGIFAVWIFFSFRKSKVADE